MNEIRSYGVFGVSVVSDSYFSGDTPAGSLNLKQSRENNKYGGMQNYSRRVNAYTCVMTIESGGNNYDFWMGNVSNVEKRKGAQGDKCDWRSSR